MPVQIEDFRLSLIWTETVLDMLDGTAAAGAGMPFLGTPYGYEHAFDCARMGDAVETPNGKVSLNVPWPAPTGQLFWTYYLGAIIPGSIDGKMARKSCVPLRTSLPLSVDANWVAARMVPEAFVYPHGIAFALTVTYQGAAVTLSESVEIGMQVVREGVFEIRQRGPRAGAKEELKVSQLARDVLSRVRADAFGKDAKPGPGMNPFTIFTVVRGNGADADRRARSKGEVHRALEAVTNWRPTWRADVLQQLDKSIVEIRSAPPSHLLYAGKRGRAVWFPALFTMQGSMIHSLSCYHRNLLLASLQVDSLCGLLRQTAMKLRDGQSLSPSLSDSARYASGIIGRLYGGHTSTYRSRSLPLQISQAGFVQDINEVRQYYNMTPLS